MSTKLSRKPLVDLPRSYQGHFPLDTDTPAFRLLDQRIERSLEQLVARWMPRTRVVQGSPRNNDRNV